MTVFYRLDKTVVPAKEYTFAPDVNRHLVFMANLDTELHLLLVKKDFFEKNPSAGKLSVGPDDPIYIALKFSGDISALKQAGFTVGSTDRKYRLRRNQPGRSTGFGQSSSG